MINRIKLKNFGPLSKLDWGDLGPINLIVGGNGTGKTFLLKAIYCSMRTLEEYKRGDDQRTAAEILSGEANYWTFQARKNRRSGDQGGWRLHYLQRCNLPRKTSYTALARIRLNGLHHWKTTMSRQRTSNSIYLPAKEVLSLHQIILKSREQDKIFGFDDTYLDLARALRQSTSKGRNYAAFAQSRQRLVGI